jgi:hypothetical protein
MNPRRLQRETIFSINRFSFGSAINRARSVREGQWPVKGSTLERRLIEFGTQELRRMFFAKGNEALEAGPGDSRFYQFCLSVFLSTERQMNSFGWNFEIDHHPLRLHLPTIS